MYAHLNIYYDSLGYLNKAAHFLGLGMRPQAYSGFLHLLHQIAPSEKLLFLAQFSLNAFSTMFLYLVVICFFRPSSLILSRVVLMLMIVNPGELYLSTWILSDTLFISLTMLWLATGIIAIMKNNVAFRIVHLFLLILLMQTRSIGLIYPVITAIFFWYSISKYRNRIIWAALPLVILFVNIETMKYFNWKITGISTYSGFSGWVLANNAMHILPYVDVNVEEIGDEDVLFVHNNIMLQIDSMEFIPKSLTYKYLWHPEYPLQQMLNKASEEHNIDHLKAWNYMSVPYKKYAVYMIRKHPVEYFKHFMLPNSKQLFYPGLGIFGYYHPSEDILNPVKEWFAYTNNYVDNYVPESNLLTALKSWLLKIWNIVLWIMIFVSLFFGATMRFKISGNPKKQVVFWGMLAWLFAYVCFSVFASAIVFRFLCPIYSIQIVLCYVIFNEKFRTFGMKIS